MPEPKQQVSKRKSAEKNTNSNQQSCTVYLYHWGYMMSFSVSLSSWLVLLLEHTVTRAECCLSCEIKLLQAGSLPSQHPTSGQLFISRCWRWRHAAGDSASSLNSQMLRNPGLIELQVISSVCTAGTVLIKNLPNVSTNAWRYTK